MILLDGECLDCAHTLFPDWQPLSDEEPQEHVKVDIDEFTTLTRMPDGDNTDEPDAAAMDLDDATPAGDTLAAQPEAAAEPEAAAIAVGPRDVPGAQMSVGISQPMAVNAAVTDLGPPVVPREAAEPEIDVVKKEGRVDIIVCPLVSVNVGKVLDHNILGIKSGEIRNRKVAAIRSTSSAEQLWEWVQAHVARYCVARIAHFF